MQPLTTKTANGSNRLCFNALYSLSALFIAFAIIGILSNALLPPLARLCDMPLNEAAISYTFHGIPRLLSDSFRASLYKLGLLTALALCAFSVFAEGIISSLIALLGFSCGCMLYYALSAPNRTVAVLIYVFFNIVGSILCLVFASLCVDAGKKLAIRSSALKTAIKLFIMFLSFCGAICLIKTIELLLL